LWIIQGEEAKLPTRLAEVNGEAQAGSLASLTL